MHRIQIMQITSMHVMQNAADRGQMELSVLFRQGRIDTAQQNTAVGSSRPDSKARRVTANTARAILRQPSLSDAEAEKRLDHLYSLADVIVQAFIERRSRSTEAPAFGNVPVSAIPPLLMSQAA